MDNHKISDATREKYEDAVVSVFMEQYAAALEASIDQEIAECDNNDFPPELNKRCLELIEKERTRKNRRKLGKQILRIGRMAAIFLAAVLAVCSVLFVSVEAFRVPVMNFFIEKADRYMQLSGKENTDTIPEGFDVNDPLAGIIPDSFVLASVEGAWGTACYTATYSDAFGAGFNLEVIRSVGNSRLDSEDAQVVPTKLLGHDAKIYIEDSQVQISWLEENLSKIFTISAVNVSEETVLICAEEVAAKFD